MAVGGCELSKGSQGGEEQVGLAPCQLLGTGQERPSREGGGHCSTWNVSVLGSFLCLLQAWKTVASHQYGIKPLQSQY